MAGILRPGNRHVAQVNGNPEPVSADPVKNASDDAEIGLQFESGITAKSSICRVQNVLNRTRGIQ
jgi:hypothetical protein